MCLLLLLLCVADPPSRGGGSAVSAALHLQTGADGGGGQPGETLELLWLPGHQEHIELLGTSQEHGGRSRP